MTTKQKTKTTLEEVAEHAVEAAHATQLRDAGIRQLRADGATLRAIGEAVGLSHSAIAKIVGR